MTRQEYINRLNNLRGLFALEIVIGHVVRNENTILFLFGKFMIISVAFFFFVSALGLVQSQETKDNYLNGFLLKKIVYLFEIAVFALTINIIIDIFFNRNLGYYIPQNNILVWFARNTNWYLFELCFFYILFYFSFKFLKEKVTFFMLVFTILLITILFLTGWLEMWYASTMGFPVGIIMGKYYTTIIKFITSLKGKILAFILTLLGLSSLLLSTESLIGMVYLRNIMCIAFLMLLTIFVSKYNLRNKFTIFLLTHSTEIYLFQFVWLNLTENYGLNWQLRLPIVIMCTILTSVIAHPLFMLIKR